MKLRFTLIVLVIITTRLFSQVNLVTNGDFEMYIQCPVTFSEINSAIPWESANSASPDFYHFCSSTFNPNLVYGPQTTHSGNGIAAIGTFYANPGYQNSREYLKIKLNDSLVALKQYYIEYFVSLAYNANYSISKFGCLVTDSNYYQNNNLVINAIPQIENPLINQLNIKNNWVKISSNYIAVGGEQYLILGNFKNDLNTDTTYLGGGITNISYYFIDDVSVIDSSSIGHNEFKNNSLINIYPNPSDGNIQIDLSKLNENGELQLSIYNTIGIEVKKEFITCNSINNVDLNELANGIYSYKLFKGKELIRVNQFALAKD